LPWCHKGHFEQVGSLQSAHRGYDVSNYLQRERLHAFPQGQRQLLMLVARKLLASSSMAIHGTLSTIIERLNLKLTDYEAQLNLTDLDDYDGIEELIDGENGDGDSGATDELTADYEGIKKEIEDLRQYAELADSIKTNAKGDNLLLALQEGFKREARGRFSCFQLSSEVYLK